MNEYTSLQKYISHTLFLMFLSCVRDEWRKGQTAILSQVLLLTIAALILHLGWVAQPGVAEGHNPQTASWLSLWPSCLQPTQLPPAPVSISIIHPRCIREVFRDALSSSLISSYFCIISAPTVTPAWLWKSQVASLIAMCYARASTKAKKLSLYSFIMPTWFRFFFRLFTQVHLLIDGLVKGLYITLISETCWLIWRWLHHRKETVMGNSAIYMYILIHYIYSGNTEHEQKKRVT